VHIALRINHRPWIMRRPGRPQPPQLVPQQGLHWAALPHRPHRVQHRPQPPEQRSDQQSTSTVQTKTMSNINEENYDLSNINEEKLKQVVL
jgi:hypothetical protein